MDIKQLGKYNDNTVNIRKHENNTEALRGWCSNSVIFTISDEERNVLWFGNAHEAEQGGHDVAVMWRYSKNAEKYNCDKKLSGIT